MTEATNPLDVSGRVVVVTGGLGRLGRGFVRTLRNRGARVVVIDTDVSAVRLASVFPDAAGAQDLFLLAGDVLDRTSLGKALAAIEARWGTPYGLVNNAALDSPPDAPATENGPLETYPETSWDKVMDVNVKGTLIACQVFGGAMARAGRGSIVNICSTYGVVSPDQSIYEFRRKGGEAFFKPVAYSASKSAILNLTRYMAVYWAPKVRVNTLTFGGVFDNQDPRFLEGYARRTPLGRMAQPGEYDGAVVFLMSDGASYMTGSNMVIDGGWTAW
jgi:NAD(P)-dependent dehydrogenase (short-subunit alcohol dehydrogenase family)